jgi:hypothetical protein
MADTTLPLVIHLGNQQALDSWFGREIERVDRIMSEHHLGTCSFEHPEYGMCGAPATVTDRDSERDVCLKHYYSAQLDRATSALESQ